MQQRKLIKSLNSSVETAFNELVMVANAYLTIVNAKRQLTKLNANETITRTFCTQLLTLAYDEDATEGAEQTIKKKNIQATPDISENESEDEVSIPKISAATNLDFVGADAPLRMDAIEKLMDERRKKATEEQPKPKHPVQFINNILGDDVEEIIEETVLEETIIEEKPLENGQKEEKNFDSLAVGNCEEWIHKNQKPYEKSIFPKIPKDELFGKLPENASIATFEIPDGPPPEVNALFFMTPEDRRKMFEGWSIIATKKIDRLHPGVLPEERKKLIYLELDEMLEQYLKDHPLKGADKKDGPKVEFPPVIV